MGDSEAAASIKSPKPSMGDNRKAAFPKLPAQFAGRSAEQSPILSPCRFLLSLYNLGKRSSITYVTSPSPVCLHLPFSLQEWRKQLYRPSKPVILLLLWDYWLHWPTGWREQKQGTEFKTAVGKNGDSPSRDRLWWISSTLFQSIRNIWDWEPGDRP